MPAIVRRLFQGMRAAAISGLGFGLETLTHSFRLITSGLFDEFPTLKIIVGHLGEAAPFMLWRTDHNLDAREQDAEVVRRLLQDAFLAHDQRRVPNSALQCAIAEMGMDRIMFSVDWPYIDNAMARRG